MTTIKRALLSVSDKTGLVPFAQALTEVGIELLSTGGTAILLRTANIPVIEVADYTGFPELMAGRLKTLHPRIHGGILGRRGQDDAALQDHNIPYIDLVVVNLYPFATKIATADCTMEQAIEHIDIGGPTMLRAAAKNYNAVTVVSDPADYLSVQTALITHHGSTSLELRFELAVKAFAHTANYDAAIANYLSSIKTTAVDTPTATINSDKPVPASCLNIFPHYLTLQWRKAQTLRYGENPHQQAAFYHEAPLHVNRPQALSASTTSITTAQQIQGKELSYNNIADADAALECLRQFHEGPTCVIVKHTNPCGVAIGTTLVEAYQHAYSTDPESAFGGIIALNQELDADCARAIIERQFVEVIITPTITTAASQILATKPNVRLLICGSLSTNVPPRWDYKYVNGGLLVQETDQALYAQIKIVTKRHPDQVELRELLFAWRVAKFVKSNAIVYSRDLMTIGIGAGQMSRVNSARIATIKAEQAGLSIHGAVLASDAFLPFRDGLDEAARVGIRAVIQPGGSARDAEVINAANEYNIAMIFTGTRHFRH